MKIYDELWNELGSSPDLSKGWLESVKKVKLHHPEIPAIEERSHAEPMAGAPHLNHLVIDSPFVPAIPAWDEYELVQMFHPYTEEELKEMNQPTIEERLTNVENAILEFMLMRGGPHV